MSAPVDVLAVMELQAYRFRAARLSREIRDCADRELREARAAVAELIERERVMRVALERIANHAADITGAPDMVAIAANALALAKERQP